jgi:predicted DCC family thiol-disulfide oxidoreductase YuxK
MAAPHGIDGAAPSTMVLIENGKLYTKSTAALRVARRLNGAWPLLFVAVLVPRFIRDAAYRLFAANRYRLFGRSEVCRVPTPEIRSRFLSA